MFFTLSKILYFLLHPLVWILGLLMAAYVFRSKRFHLNLIVAALLTFIIFSNQFIFCEAMKRWEGQKSHDLGKNYKAVILLGGYSGFNSSQDYVSFNEGADRFIYTQILYQQGLAEKILLTGGSGLLTKPEEKESAWTYEMMVTSGIPTGDIILEENSRNTYENAVFSAKLLHEKYGEGESYLLVTSAFHMRRAKACFEKAGLDVTEYKVDFLVDDDDYVLSTFLVPSAGILEKWTILFKEWIGYSVYWLRGYL